MATFYVADGYAEGGYVQTDIEINWGTKVIFVPKFFLTLLGGSLYELDTNAFRLALKELEDNAEGMVYPDTHNHNTTVLLGGIEYARIIEMINGYTVTFEDGQYSVSLVGSNNNISDVVNVNQVSVKSNNSAGLIQTREIQQSSYEGKVAIDTTNGTAGTIYPQGTLLKPVNNLVDAKFIAAYRGLDSYYVKSNLALGSTDNVTALKFYGDGATLNVYRTTITLTQGCITTNSQWYNCRITGYQGGESLYHDCVIDGLENAHCLYERCGLADGTTRGYTIKQSNTVSSGHASYFKECYSDEGTAILDRNGAKMNVTFDGFHGRLKIINQNAAASSGQVWIHLNGGTVTVDSTCTKGKVTITGFGTLINNSLGTEVDASGFAAEVAAQARIDVESLRSTHQGFGSRWFVDPVLGTDLAPGNSPVSPLKTVTAALAKAVSGRGDVIYLLAPGAGTANIDERIVVNKEDVHIRGPGRGVQFQPTTGTGDVITVNANNCSFSSFIVRAQAGSTTDNCIVINGKFSEFRKLYLVGTESGSGNGFLFNGGDYHELHDCESEKMGGSGLKTVDMLTSNGSPREISIFGGNYYLNKKDGIELTGSSSNPTNSTRIIRIMGANVHDNVGYGVSADANSTRIVIDSASTVHSNGFGEILNLSPSLQHFSDRELITQVKYRVESLRPTHQAFGSEFYVDPYNGNDNGLGTSDFNPFQTLTRALAECVSGRGDVIYLLAPNAGAATINERILIDKEDIHIRGPGRGVQIQPSVPDIGPVINITANNCSLGGFIVRTAPLSTLDDAIVVRGKFSKMDKLYIVGSGQTGFGTTSRGIVYEGGDYHELHDIEVEKFGDSGIELDDKSAEHSNGSPREISIFGGNIYLNGEHGICLHGKTGAALGSTSRLIRILRGANIHDNLSVGIHSDANVLGVVIDDSVLLHANNGGNEFPQVELNGTGYYKAEETMLHTAGAVWDASSADHLIVGSTGAKLSTASSGGVDYAALADAVRVELTPELTHVMLLENGLTASQATVLQEIYSIFGLDVTKPLVVTGNARTAGAGITQQIVTNSNQTVITRV
jgi:hypothetical protein